MASYFTPRYPEYDFLLKEPKGTVGRHLHRRATIVKIAAQRQVGVKTGKLKSSIKIHTHSSTYYGQSITVGSDVSYALMHHNGTKPHVILPVRAPQLVFRTRGRLVRTNRVHHPGTRANRYLSDNLRYAVM